MTDVLLTDDIQARVLQMAEHLERWAALLDREYQKQLRIDETWTTLEIAPDPATKLINSLKNAAANLRLLTARSVVAADATDNDQLATDTRKQDE